MAELKQNKWAELSDKVAEMSLRERVIIAVTLAVLVLFVWLQFVYWPIEDDNKRVQKELTNTNTAIAEQAQLLADLETQLRNNPNKPLREEQARLKEAMERLKEEIETRLSILVPPEQMADLLKSVLDDYKGLTLISAKNLAVEPIRIGGTAKAEGVSKGSEDDDTQAVIYSHGFELTLGGSYFQALEFLQKLESIDGFFWTHFDYEVVKYPDAKVVIQVNTLSLEEDWIGV